MKCKYCDLNFKHNGKFLRNHIKNYHKNNLWLNRFFSKVIITNTCWLWKGSLNNTGYGEFKFNYKMCKSHRLIYEFFICKIKKGNQIHHICRNPICVNPNHLEQVTQEYNIQQIQRKYKKYCKYGHEMFGNNLYINSKTNARNCRKCRTYHVKRYYDRKKEILT